METLINILKKLIIDKFYGKITITFENGKIVHVEKRESIKV